MILQLTENLTSIQYLLKIDLFAQLRLLLDLSMETIETADQPDVFCRPERISYSNSLFEIESKLTLNENILVSA